MADANRYRFSSKRFIASAGTYYFGYRFYEPNLQRWLNADPIGEEGGLNLYGCALNDPVNRTDPFGLDPNMATLFIQNVLQNGLSDARRFNDRLAKLIEDTAVGAVKTAYKAVTDPGGLAYDIYEGTANFGTMLGKLSADPCARKRAWDDFKNHMLTPEGMADATFFVESTLGGRLLSPKAATTGAVTVAEETAELESGVHYLYQKVGAAGEHLKFGVTDDLAGRYTSVELKGGRLKVLAQGERPEMLRLERELHKTLPIGPEEGQTVYEKIQVSKGLLPRHEYPYPP